MGATQDHLDAIRRQFTRQADVTAAFGLDVPARR